MREERNTGGTKVYVACSNRNQQLFVVDIFLHCFFFCSIEIVASPCFFFMYSIFSSLNEACLCCRAPKHHKISLSTATLSRVGANLCEQARVLCVLPVHNGAAASEAVWKESFDVGLSKKSTVRLSPLGTSRKMFTFISNNLQHQAYIFTSITVRQKPF